MKSLFFESESEYLVLSANGDTLYSIWFNGMNWIVDHFKLRYEAGAREIC